MFKLLFVEKKKEEGVSILHYKVLNAKDGQVVGNTSLLEVNKELFNVLDVMTKPEVEEVLRGFIGLTEEEYLFLLSKPQDKKYLLVMTMELEPSYKRKGFGKYLLQAIETTYPEKDIILCPYPILPGVLAFNIQYAKEIRKKLISQYSKYGYKLLDNGMMIK